MSVGIRIENLSVRFLEEPILHTITAEFLPQNISVLLGKSGSGKTTLLRAINRLNEEFEGCVTTGQIQLITETGAIPVYPQKKQIRAPLPLTALRLRVGMLFQTPHVFPVSIFRNIAMPLTLVGQCPQGNVEARVHEALHLVGLWDEVKDRLNASAEHLSGGQQQRLCLARVLALRPEVLLLDEPTASLDVHAGRHVEEVLTTLSADYTIVMVSHSLSQAKRLADSLFICENGRITHHLHGGEELSEDVFESML